MAKETNAMQSPAPTCACWGAPLLAAWIQEHAVGRHPGAAGQAGRRCLEMWAANVRVHHAAACTLMTEQDCCTLHVGTGSAGMPVLQGLGELTKAEPQSQAVSL
jgi:hypothetical protein